MENLRRWKSSIKEIGEIIEVRPDVFRCTGPLGFCYRELTDKNEKGERVVIESDYGPAYDETAQICRITGEITMTQEQYETEFESDPAYKKKAGVTNLQEAVEDVMWETYSLGHSFPSPVSA